MLYKTIAVQISTIKIERTDVYTYKYHLLRSLADLNILFSLIGNTNEETCVAILKVFIGSLYEIIS